MIPARVWVISDIHIDYQQNYDELVAFANRGFPGDALIIAGDATDRMERLQCLFQALVPKFKHVLFVPGNHEMWVRRSQHADSLQKFYAIQEMCESSGVKTEPVRLGQYQKVWLVPLLSWYDDKDQPETTLYYHKEYGEDRTDDMWGDFFHTSWPEAMQSRLAQWFAGQNEVFLQCDYDDPVISFSHFLPRQELVFHKPIEETVKLAAKHDPLPEFNFTRVAGSLRIEQQIRQLGSTLHVYGHQHRNRMRSYDGVKYFSHCMGYPKERQRGHVCHSAVEPKCVWREDTGFQI